MGKQTAVVPRGQGETLNVLGAGVRFLCTADQTEKSWSLMEVDVPEGSGPPPHHHFWDEAYYVLCGRIRFSIEGKDQVVEAGDFIYAPGGTVHGFKGISTETARMLIFDAPAHAEAFFREVDQEVKGPHEFAKVPQIGSRHQIEFLRP